MRSHSEAARMMGDRVAAAVGIERGSRGMRRLEVVPAMAVRAMLADLVPFEELDSVMEGVAASADRLTEMACRSFDVDPMSEGAETFAPSAFMVAGQEIAYALLMAETDKALKAPAAAEMAMCVLCSTRIENVPGSGRCARCHRPVHGGRA